MSFELKHGPGNPRNSEGAFVELKDGRILFVYSKYRGGDWHDHCVADLVSLTSSDGGRSWSQERVAVKNDSMNVMSVSLLRLQDGRIAMVYLRKSKVPGSSFIDCRPFIRFSADEAESWSAPIDMSGVPPAYLVGVNDRLIQLKSGRLVMPVACHRYLPTGDGFGSGIVYFLLSDDAGKTWRQSSQCCYPPMWVESGLQEPGVVELADGRVLAWFRTDAGCQYKSWSSDGGETWTVPIPAQEFPGPCAPLSMKRDPVTGTLVAIWNDTHPARSVSPAEGTGGRTPLVMAFSRDGGIWWKEHKVLENDPQCGYCYTAMLFRGKELLLEYNCGGHGENFLQDARIRVVPLP